jgi:hypothetical protein
MEEERALVYSACEMNIGEEAVAIGEDKKGYKYPLFPNGHLSPALPHSPNSKE